ncbi:MAG: dihydroorotase [Tagaea sp.]|nr:dihydroorotase [Tagaea sp.]
MTDRLVIRRPDDWHAHFRDGAMLAAVAPLTARQFARAIVMPNLVPPVTTVAAASAYRERIRNAAGPGFEPLMTVYLTDGLDPDAVERGHAEGVWVAAKLYPAHATTNSAHGVTDIAKIARVLDRMRKIGMPLLVHGEVTHKHVDIFDREKVFIDEVLAPARARHPGLKIVFEHITTREAAEYVASASADLAATITPHHLHIDRNAIFEGGVRPHLYCLPIAKRAHHRTALRKAATSGDARFFLGTDTAPHTVETKEAACGCAGIFNAPAALEAYLQVFDEENALDKFEAFASLNGPAFYGLPVNETRVALSRAPHALAEATQAAGTRVVNFLGGRTLPWRYDGPV